jgi:UDP:flavonoid glycosyltransferase YjiC (YdhE family)
MEKSLKTQLRGRKILFACVPGDGHFNPLTGLAKYLQEEGECDVRWYTSDIFRKKLTRIGIHHYPFVQAKDINAENMEDVMPERNLITDPVEKLNYDMVNFFAQRGPEYFRDIVEIYKTFPFSLMIADSIFTGIPFVSKKMGIPVVSIGVVPLPASSNDLAPYGMAIHPPKNDEERSKLPALYEQAYGMFKSSIDVFEGILQDHGIETDGSLMSDVLIDHADYYLQIGSPSFEYPRTDLGNNVRFVGGLLPYSSPIKMEDGWYDARLNKYARKILVTQGTVEKETHKIIEPTIKAFIDTDTLVIVTTGGSGTEELRKKYNAPNIIIEDYIPFDEVMPLVDVYVTNGGYSGTLLAIKHNLPIVAAGLHEGKSEICARIGYFEYGIDLRTEAPDPLAIYDAVVRVVTDNRYKDNVTRLSEEFRSFNPNELSAKYISSLLAARPVAQKV